MNLLHYYPQRTNFKNHFQRKLLLVMFMFLIIGNMGYFLFFNQQNKSVQADQNTFNAEKILQTLQVIDQITPRNAKLNSLVLSGNGLELQGISLGQKPIDYFFQRLSAIRAQEFSRQEVKKNNIIEFKVNFYERSQ